jgi:hypothetical protein
MSGNSRFHLTDAGVAAVLAAVLLCATAAGWTQAPDAADQRAIELIEHVLELDDLSEALWPDWQLSGTPVVLMDGHGDCYLLHHPDPPPGFSRVRDRRRNAAAVYSGPAESDQILQDARTVGRAATAFLSTSDLAQDGLPKTLCAAFRAHLMKRCPNLSQPVSLQMSYPVDGRSLALVDIECELLRRVLTAPPDSLEERVLEFVSIRALRRVSMSERFVHYERWLESVCGLSGYIGEMSRAEAGAHLDGDSRELLENAIGEPWRIEECHPDVRSIDWYRSERFLWSGAAVCVLMDRYHPGWKAEVARGCTDPFEVLFELTKLNTPRAAVLLERHGFEERLREREAFVVESKSPAERLYEDITGSDEPLLVVKVHLLSSVSVSYDRDSIEKVDEYRAVHKRVLKIQYSGGTAVEVMGLPSAAVTGVDEFDFRQLTLKVPEALKLTVLGEEEPLDAGVHHVDRSFTLEGLGLRIVGTSAVIIVGDNGLSIVIHR